jgi:aminoglycoside phosphotransferase (APT) family kinase protein
VANLSMPPTSTPEHEVEVTVALVRALIAEQCPDLAGAPLVEGPSGWDNALVRIGDDLAARLPRREIAARISTSEIDWLPRVSAHWTFPVPAPVIVGKPGCGYPWRWSVVPWLVGSPVLGSPLTHDGAAEFGAAVAEVHQSAPDAAPRNPFRSQSLAARAERFEARLAMLGERVDADRARGALAAADAWQDGTWCHLDLHGNNVLSVDGRFAGILDWGDSATGDAATDLGQAWYLLGSELYERFAEAYSGAGGTGYPHAPRVRAEAVAYAVTMASLDDEAYSASGWKSLEDLGVARRN